VWGRNFLSTDYELPTWKTTQSEGQMSWLSPVGGNLELQFFKQIISLSLEFESAFWANEWPASK
jgi:hypothetical protein